MIRSPQNRRLKDGGYSRNNKKFSAWYKDLAEKALFDLSTTQGMADSVVTTLETAFNA